MPTPGWPGAPQLGWPGCAGLQTGERRLPCGVGRTGQALQSGRACPARGGLLPTEGRLTLLLGRCPPHAGLFPRLRPSLSPSVLPTSHSFRKSKKPQPQPFSSCTCLFSTFPWNTSPLRELLSCCHLCSSGEKKTPLPLSSQLWEIPTKHHPSKGCNGMGHAWPTASAAPQGVTWWHVVSSKGRTRPPHTSNKGPQSVIKT